MTKYFFIFVLLISCSAQSPTNSPSKPENPLVTKGKSVYLTQCIACHNPDPAKDGPVGPSVKGSSRELLAARILHQSYPPGYTPKRASQAMIALPHLADDIEAIHAFLNSN